MSHVGIILNTCDISLYITKIIIPSEMYCNVLEALDSHWISCTMPYSFDLLADNKHYMRFTWLPTISSNFITQDFTWLILALYFSKICSFVVSCALRGSCSVEPIFIQWSSTGRVNEPKMDTKLASSSQRCVFPGLPDFLDILVCSGPRMLCSLALWSQGLFCLNIPIYKREERF